MEEEKITFKDKTFVFTGDMSLGRDEAKSKVTLLGGRCTIQPSSKTDYLVLGTDPGYAKVGKARALNIRLVYEEEFMRSLSEAFVKEEKGKGMCESLSPKKETVHTRVEKGRVDDSHTKENQNVSPISNMWSEKYRPVKKEELVGNSTLFKSLEDFLKGKTKFKAALLSGPPGIGKTTSAHIICRDLGLDVVEFNASDVRSKGALVTHVKGLVDTYGISNHLKMKHKVLIMDEVDGMSSDRGGLLELSGIIKKSRVPIICICNDRNNQKIRTLANYCLDLRFRKLDARQILPRLKTILKKENRLVGDNILNEIISLGHGDMRYILNSLQYLSMKSLSINFSMPKKVLAKNSFELASEAFQRRPLSQKLDLYFQDYSLIPLFVQENFLKMDFKSLGDLYESSESISQGDVVEKMIRGANQEWSLAPLHGFLSVVAPTHGKALHKKIDFPSWLGQNSKHQKHLRIIQEIKTHASIHLKSSTYDFRLFDSNLIFLDFLSSLRNDEVEKVINKLIRLDLLKDDFVNLSEIILKGSQAFKEIKTKTKGDLTRAYKKIKRNLPYTINEGKEEDEEE